MENRADSEEWLVKSRRASIAEVLPLLLGPTNTVVGLSEERLTSKRRSILKLRTRMVSRRIWDAPGRWPRAILDGWCPPVLFNLGRLLFLHDSPVWCVLTAKVECCGEWHPAVEYPVEAEW